MYNNLKLPILLLGLVSSLASATPESSNVTYEDIVNINSGKTISTTKKQQIETKNKALGASEEQKHEQRSLDELPQPRKPLDLVETTQASIYGPQLPSGDIGIITAESFNITSSQTSPKTPKQETKIVSEKYSFDNDSKINKDIRNMIALKSGVSLTQEQREDLNKLTLKEEVKGKFPGTEKTMKEINRYISEARPALSSNQTELKDVELGVLSEEERDALETVSDLSTIDLLKQITRQESEMDNKKVNIVYQASLMQDQVERNDLEKLYIINARLLKERQSEVSEVSIEEVSDQDYIGDYDEFGNEIIKLDEVVVTASESNLIIDDFQDASTDNETIVCVTDSNTSALEDELSELKSSLDSMNENYQTLMQAMMMNNLMMSQNNLLMSQMLLNNSIQNQYYGPTQVGENKTSLDNLIDSHYRNYMQAPPAPNYDMYAQNNTPFTSNYMPQTNNQLNSNIYQSDSMFQTGPIYPNYSPGVNFSFNNVYDQPRLNNQAQILL